MTYLCVFENGFVCALHRTNNPLLEVIDVSLDDTLHGWLNLDLLLGQSNAITRFLITCRQVLLDLPELILPSSLTWFRSLVVGTSDPNLLEKTLRLLGRTWLVRDLRDGTRLALDKSPLLLGQLLV